MKDPFADPCADLLRARGPQKIQMRRDVTLPLRYSILCMNAGEEWEVGDDSRQVPPEDARRLVGSGAAMWVWNRKQQEARTDAA